TSGPGFRPDELPCHLDRAIEVVGVAREAERAPFGALALPGTPVRRDQPKPAIDLLATGGPDEPPLGGRPKEERVGEEVRVQALAAARVRSARLEQRDGLLDQGQAA